MDVKTVERLLGDAKLHGIGLHVAERCPGGLLHHVAELTRKDELTLAGHPQRLHVQNLAADGRPGQARSHAGHAGVLADLGLEAVRTEDGLDLADVDAPWLDQRPGGLLDRQRAADVGQPLLQRAHAGFTRVRGDDAGQRGVSQLDARA